MSTQETVFYRDRDVLITDRRAVLGGTTYSMANITSVSTRVIPPNRAPGIAVAIAGGLLTVCCGCLALAPLPFLSLSQGNTTTGIIGSTTFMAIGVVIGILILGGGIALAVMSKPTYAVRISSASGEADALVSKDREYIERIAVAMNEAIIKRG